MNNFTYHYPVRQYFGKGCAEEAVKGELKQANLSDETNETVMRHAAGTCFITPGCRKQLSRDKIFGILKERM